MARIKVSEFLEQHPDLADAQVNNTLDSWKGISGPLEYGVLYVDTTKVDEMGWCDTLYLKMRSGAGFQDGLSMFQELFPDEVRRSGRFFELWWD